MISSNNCPLKTYVSTSGAREAIYRQLFTRRAVTVHSGTSPGGTGKCHRGTAAMARHEVLSLRPRGAGPSDCVRFLMTASRRLADGPRFRGGRDRVSVPVRPGTCGTSSRLLSSRPPCDNAASPQAAHLSGLSPRDSGPSASRNVSDMGLFNCDGLIGTAHVLEEMPEVSCVSAVAAFWGPRASRLSARVSRRLVQPPRACVRLMRTSPMN